MKKLLSVVALGMMLTGCGGGGSTTPTPQASPPPTPNIVSPSDAGWGAPQHIYSAPTTMLATAQLDDHSTVALVIDPPSGHLKLARFSADGHEQDTQSVSLEPVGQVLAFGGAHMVADTVGGVIISWRQVEPNPTTSDPYVELHVARYDRITGAISQRQIPRQQNGSVENQSLSVRPDGSAVISWVERQIVPNAPLPGNRAVFYSKFTLSTGWSQPVQVSPDLEYWSSRNTKSAAVAAGTGRAAVLWTVEGLSLNGTLINGVMAGEDGVFGAPFTAFDGLGPVGSNGTAIALDTVYMGDDGAIMAFEMQGNKYGYQRYEPGTGWIPFDLIVDNPAVGISTAMNAKGQGFVALTYGSLIVVGFDNSGFGTSKVFANSSDVYEAFHPNIAIGADGSAVLVWGEFDMPSPNKSLIKGSIYSPNTGWSETATLRSLAALDNNNVSIAGKSASFYWLQPAEADGAATEVWLLQFSLPN